MQTAKERLLYYINNQNIKPQDFYRENSLSHAYLNTKGAVSSKNLEKILINHVNLNADWVITGRGDMMLNDTSKNTITQNSNLESLFKEMAIPSRALTQEEDDKYVLERLQKPLEKIIKKIMHDNSISKNVERKRVKQIQKENTDFLNERQEILNQNKTELKNKKASPKKK